MTERIVGERVCSKDRGYYHRIPGTIRRDTVTMDGELAYVVDLDNGQMVVMTPDILDTPTDADVATFQAKQERDAAYEAERLAKLERKRQRNQEHEAELERRRQAEQEQREADAMAERLARLTEQRKRNGRVFGLESLKR